MPESGIQYIQTPLASDNKLVPPASGKIIYNFINVSKIIGYSFTSIM